MWQVVGLYAAKTRRYSRIDDTLMTIRNTLTSDVMWTRATDLCASVHKFANRLPVQEYDSLYKKLREFSERIPRKIAQAVQSAYISKYCDRLIEARDLCVRVRIEIYLSQELEYVDTDVANRLLEQIDIFYNNCTRLIRHYDAMSSALNPFFAYQALYSSFN